MLYQQTQKHLVDLRLRGMAELNENHQNDTAAQSLSFDERFGLLVDAEVHDRAQRKQLRFTKAAKLKYNDASIEDINYTAKRGLDKNHIVSLKGCQWIKRSQHLLITGSTGTGKTWLGCAFAHQAIRKEFQVFYFRVPRLLEDMEIARADGSLPNLRTKLMKASLIVLDDWAVAPLTVRGRQDLLEIVEDKTGSGSILITSQVPINKWHDFIGEPTLADAILDRLVHRAHHIELKGESMRKLNQMNKENE